MSGIADAWWFVGAAYAVAVGGTIVLVVASIVALRRAEARADALARRE